MIYITSSSNPTIKEIKTLYRKKERWTKKSFLAEGIKIVEEYVDKKYPISYIVVSENLHNIRGGEALLDKIQNHKYIIQVPDKLYKEISDMESPQGVLAVVKFELDYIQNLHNKENPFILLLDKVQDPGNMGTIIRTADAFGVDGIIVTDGCVDIYNPKVVRATMGSIFRVPIYHYSIGAEIIEELKSKNIKIYSTSLKGNRFIQNTDFNKPSLLIIGNESKGVSKHLEALADDLIKIPMVGEAESLNAAVASSIIMYEVARQRNH
ncbi:23S rRNA (guanosine(2251)-2'-O)-methyltransferase RlmB [Schnuerera sp.]|uniref:23S rRNA (guanosine(2251)-2'-O)-methyltransferase RlmB n=1 Tax=Schnuerera sp. TaxID=2794844 RepID=UPI002B9DBAFE|nr:23S rRNA (guanosine(2251)-2'-O)-methyltransferase RlmB [Schnuerera sp.]HSH35449.1 23S rRNA (guanosine(2251)-2'-O)-methyltransferase RlmB [Schnuerera sp.]